MDESKQMTSTDTLIKMINQIASNMAPGRNTQDAASATADHLIRFWARSMKFQLISNTKNNVQQLNPIAVKAIEILSRHYEGVQAV
ncbi:MAG: formate dehydrogenase subunit delta [Gammaproteobacteria bacterium]|nr:formate dehydrogenase subunit delta [Gammaproteobacteria bacterium]